MKKVLFSVEKFSDIDHPEYGGPSHDYTIMGSLASSNMGTVVEFRYDQFTKEKPDADIDAALVRRCEEARPDMVMATHVIQYGEKNIKPATYGHIKDELKIPVAMYWGESAPDVVKHADIFASHISVNVFSDTRDEWKKHTMFPEKCVHLFEPKDTALFKCDGSEKRDIPLSFIGQTFGRMDRALNLGFLWGKGVGYVRAGGQRENNLHISDYANFLRRSVVTIGFSSAITFQHLTGRTIEACLCGALLLESENGETPNLLDPYADYVPFKEHFHYVNHGQIAAQDGDLAEKALHYAYQKPEEARRIAESGRRKVLERCDGREFWGKLFETVGIKDES